MIKYLLVIFCVPLSFATEVDSFTDRNIQLTDSSGRINQITNELFREAVKAANDNDEVCEKSILYQEIYNKMGGFLWAELETRILEDTTIDKRYFTRENSIYGDLGFFQFLPHYLVEMGSLINIKGHLVGVDKIGHFNGIGYHYFEIAYLEGLGVEEALKYGESYERGFFGLVTTGVYSYGDLAANYLGMKFWLQVIGNDPAKSFVSCEGTKWVLNKTFYWEDYIDSSVDEAINCNKYRDEQFEKAITSKMKYLNNNGTKSRALECPIRTDECKILRVKYGPLADRIINPDC